ncbi:MAG: hypothetical protein BLITH_1256 [Brockia lithotrophica]|uniref:Uncharacterized protein n=1 Tax=Brockia lithotrophica TaxID=933949 RepID=A0A2T5G614_9BACL|nr:MAG: hypothetical protein BLITH_1256 [Brockia lithotrophica]
MVERTLLPWERVGRMALLLFVFGALSFLILYILIMTFSVLWAVTGQDLSAFVHMERDATGIEFRATPLLVVIALALSGALTYAAARTYDGRSRRLRAGWFVLVLAVAVIVALFGYIAPCGIVCPSLTCHGPVVSCSTEFLLKSLSVKYVCLCR